MINIISYLILNSKNIRLLLELNYDTIQSKVEYSLTEKGKALLIVLDDLHKWGKEQMKVRIFRKKLHKCEVEFKGHITNL